MTELARVFRYSLLLGAVAVSSAAAAPLPGTEPFDPELQARIDAALADRESDFVPRTQHRAPDGATYDDYGARQRGYMRTQDVVAIFAANGFELAAQSEINANPKDPANWEGGVWTLPPSLGFGRQSEEEMAKHRAIGESDRMTLLFKKAN